MELFLFIYLFVYFTLGMSLTNIRGLKFPRSKILLFPLLHFLRDSNLSSYTCGLDSKASVYNAGDPGSIPGLGRSPGEGNGNLLQGVAKSQTRLSDFTFTFFL